MRQFSSLQLLLVWSGFLVGVVVAQVWSVTLEWYVCGLLLALGVVGGWRRAGGPWATGAPPLATWLLTTGLFILLALAGMARLQWADLQFTNSDWSEKLEREVAITGQVVREPDVRAQFAQLYVQVGDELLLVRTDRYTTARYGDTVTATGQLTAPEVFDTDTGREFNYPGYLQARGVQHILAWAEVEVTATGGGNPLIRGLLWVKGEFVAAVTASLPPPQSDLGLGLLLGIKQALGDELETAFRRTGLIHIVVLSGYNVMLVIAFFWWVSSWVLPLRGRVVFGLVGIGLFVIIVGPSATVVRASIMASLLLLAKYIGARYDVLRALLLAALMMVVLNPYLLFYDLGFQLSFLATLGLVLVLPQFETTVVTDTKGVGLKDIFYATLVTQLAVLPLLVYAIGEVSVVAVAVNVVVLPVVAAAMALTFVAGVTTLISPVLALPFAWLAYLVLSYIIVVVTWVGGFSWAAAKLPPITLWQLAGCYILLGFAWYGWVRWRDSGALAAHLSRALDEDVPVAFR